MIPAPKLDDRTYADIVAEAMRLIPRYCPEWTNHNPSDPGITMLELTAWMTELILYRLNRVPEKNYLAFLDLIGVRLRSPQPAHALITFDLVQGADRQTIRIGTQVATPQAADEDTVVFETQRELLVTGIKLDRCFSYFDETYADNSPFLGGSRPEGFEAFAGADRIERFLYLGDMRFSSLNNSTVLRVNVNAPETGGRDLARLGVLERSQVARAAPDRDGGRARRGGLLRPRRHPADHRARARGHLDPRPPRRGAAEQPGDRGRHRAGGDRDDRRGVAAGSRAR
jgi:hypothetical protein